MPRVVAMGGSANVDKLQNNKFSRIGDNALCHVATVFNLVSAHVSEVSMAINNVPVKK